MQIMALLLGNANWPGFVNGSLYQGSLKNLCLPGLNCYSCPGALGACPLGSLQNGLADPFMRIPFYVLGFLILTGSIMGRFVCGWLCPFGLIQEALHGIPSRKFRPDPALRLQKGLLQIKYAVLAVFIILIPVAGLYLQGYGSPAFCSYLCPSGTLMAGIPLLLANAELRPLAGWLFSWKMIVLIGFLTGSVFLFRPFCRYFCPLGALYGLFNRISLYRVSVDQSRCDECGICSRQCPVSLPVTQNANSPECIRCGACAAVCPKQAVRCGFSIGKQPGVKDGGRHA